MTRLSATIDITVPPAICIAAVQETMTDQRLLDAYRVLRAGKQYAGFVTMLVPGRRMVIEYAALEPTTNRRSHATGWKVTYEFPPTSEGALTRVEVAVEYGLLTAIAGAGMIRAQAENEIQHRLAALRMLEFGFGTPDTAREADVRSEALGE